MPTRSATTRFSTDRSGRAASCTPTPPRPGGRSRFIEDLIREQVLPTYGNTHTEASAIGRRTTALREDARRIIHHAVGGGEGGHRRVLRLGRHGGD